MLFVFLFVCCCCFFFGGGGPDMTFFNFLCQDMECVGLSETVLESLPDSDNFNYFIFYKIYTNVPNRLQEIRSRYMDCR